MRKTRFAQIGVLGCLFMALLALPASAAKIAWVSFHGDNPIYECGEFWLRECTGQGLHRCLDRGRPSSHSVLNA